jgi:hypothetical protein
MALLCQYDDIYILTGLLTLQMEALRSAKYSFTSRNTIRPRLSKTLHKTCKVQECFSMNAAVSQRLESLMDISTNPDRTRQTT